MSIGTYARVSASRWVAISASLRPRLFCGTKTVPVASRGIMAPASPNSNHNNVAMISLQETTPLEIQLQLLLLEAPSL